MYQYDIAISYESEKEKFVQEVVDYLKGEKWQIFFAPYMKEELLSENLKSKLFQVYQNESLLKVLFVTKEYLKSEYTQLEARRSLSSVKDEPRRLIVVNFLGTKLPEVLKPYVYLEGDGCADEFAFLISNRVKELKKNIKGVDKESGNKELDVKNINFVANNKGIVSGNQVTIGHMTIH